MSKVRLRKYVKPYLRKNNPKCKKKFSKVKGHNIWVMTEVPDGLSEEET